jgi:hypothetical protein
MIRFKILAICILLVTAFSPQLAGARWSLIPRIYVEEEYDDNIFLTERNEQDDFITTFSPGIKLLYEDPTSLVDLDYEFRRSIYSDFSDLNYSSHRGRLEARKDFVYWFGAGIRETFISEEDPIELTGIPEFERPSTRTGRRNRYTRNIVEPEATFRFGENRSILFGYRNQILRNEEDDIADLDENAINGLLTFRFNIHNGIEIRYEHMNLEYGTTFPPEPDRDHKGDEVRGRYTYYFDPRTSAFLEYRYYHRDFDLQRPRSGIVDYEVHDPRLGFSRELYENISVTLSGGYAISDADTREKEETFAGRGDLNLIYKRLRTTLYGESGFGEDWLSTELLGFFEFWRAGFTAEYQLLERLWIDGYFLFEEDKFVDIRRKDKIWNGRAGPRYQPLRWLFLSLIYEYYERDSNIADESYKDNRFIGRITLQYDVAEHFQ